MADLRPEVKAQGEAGDGEKTEGGKLSHWRKEGASKSKVKYVYKSVDEVLEDQGKTKTYKREFK